MAKFISTAPKKPKKSKVIIFLNVLIAILTALVIIMLISHGTNNMNGYYNRKFGDNYEQHELRNGNYAGLIYDYYYNGGSIGRVDKGSEDLAAVAEYAEAAFRKSAYEKAGDTERANVQNSRMEKAAAASGIYSPEITKIDELLKR